ADGIQWPDDRPGSLLASDDVKTVGRAAPDGKPAMDEGRWTGERADGMTRGAYVRLHRTTVGFVEFGAGVDGEGAAKHTTQLAASNETGDLTRRESERGEVAGEDHVVLHGAKLGDR